MRSGTELAREIQLTDWSTAGNMSSRSSGVQIPHDICTRFGRYLYSTRCSWIIKDLNPIQTGLFWSICDWGGGGGGLLGPPLFISGTSNARVMIFTHNDHLRTKKPHTQF